MVALPSAAPFIATGIRLASAVAIILDIAAGFITGRINGPGLGAYIADASTGAGNTTAHPGRDGLGRPPRPRP